MRITGKVRRLAVLGSSTGILLAAVATGFAATPASASAQRAGVITHQFTAAQQRASLAYWTPARMAAAKNVDMMTIKGSPKTSTAPREAPGPAGSAPGSAPGGGSAGSATPATSAVPTDGYTYPFPFTRFQVFPTKLWATYPYEVNGKVFFTNDGGNYVCSGTSVSTPDLREVWTAGHCVANTDGTSQFDTSFVFVPAYNGNVSKFDPRKEWTADNLGTTTAWLNSGDLSLDEGAAHIANIVTRTNTYLLGNVVGTAGFSWNGNWIQDFVDFGYPQASPFNGNNLIECNASSAVQDTGIGGGGSPPIGIGCDMTGGSSGGSWNISWGGGGTGWINGHNDYKYSNQPLAMYSPYQDTTSNTIRCIFYAPGSGDGC